MAKSKLEELNYKRHNLYSNPYYKHKYEDTIIIINKDCVHFIQNGHQMEMSFDEIEAIFDELLKQKRREFKKNERYRQDDGTFVTIYRVDDTTISYVIDGKDEVKSFDKDSMYARSLRKL